MTKTIQWVAQKVHIVQEETQEKRTEIIREIDHQTGAPMAIIQTCNMAKKGTTRTESIKEGTTQEAETITLEVAHTIATTHMKAVIPNTYQRETRNTLLSPLIVRETIHIVPMRVSMNQRGVNSKRQVINKDLSTQLTKSHIMNQKLNRRNHNLNQICWLCCIRQ